MTYVTVIVDEAADVQTFLDALDATRVYRPCGWDSINAASAALPASRESAA